MNKDDKVESPPKSDNPFLVSDLPAADSQTGGGENPFLNFDQSAITVDETAEKLDSNNNEKLNELSDKLDGGLTVTNKDTSPLPDCPPSSPFTRDVQQDGQPTASDNDVKKAINILSSESE